MARNLQIDSNLNAADQRVSDQSGTSSPLALSTQRVLVGTPGDGNILLALGSERSWVFKQTGTGATTALELTAASADNNNKNFLLNTQGRVGIGTTAPQARFHVDGGAVHISNPGDGNVILTLGTARAWVFKQTGTDATTALELTAATASNNNKNFLINTDGRVGIGTKTPRSKLDVNGSITVEDDIILAGADCAEDFEIGDDAPSEPGTVMVINDDGRLCQSQKAYDRRVAGILSGAGSLRPGIVLGRKSSSQGTQAIALTGTTYCRIDASIHPVAVGDLLTTSDRPGHAMSAQDPERSFGAVIGKALGNLTGGVGLVRVLVALQ